MKLLFVSLFFFPFFAFAQSKDSVRLPEQEKGAFYAVSQPYTFNTVVQIADLDFDANLINKTGKYYALLIGVQDYKDVRLANLRNPVIDAQNLSDVLTEEYLFEKENTRFLKNPTRSSIIKALDSLTKIITISDNVLIFYAGHGYWDGALETGYWLPADAFHDNKANWLSNIELLNYLKNIKSKHTLLITDACFSGSIFKSQRKVGDFEEADVLIQRLYETPSRRAMTSGSLTTVPDQSAFLEYLIKQLRKNQDAFLPATDLFVAIKNPIIRASQQNALPQYSELNLADHSGGDFIFPRRVKK